MTNFFGVSPRRVIARNNNLADSIVSVAHNHIANDDLINDYVKFQNKMKYFRRNSPFMKCQKCYN